METFFQQLCEEDEPSMWRHAVAGLLRIGSEPAICALTTEVRARRGDRKFLAAVESIVSSQSQSLPRTILAELSAAGLTNAATTNVVSPHER
jgi:hypothetical protein